MTVAELIAELQKYPTHHRVFVEYDTYFDNDDGGQSVTDWSGIHEVRAGEECSVVIDISSWTA